MDTEELEKKFDAFDAKIARIREELNSTALRTPKGKLGWGWILTDNGSRMSSEKLAGMVMTFGPLVLIPFLISRGVDPVIVGGLGTWFSTFGASKWRNRTQADKGSSGYDIRDVGQ